MFNFNSKSYFPLKGRVCTVHAYAQTSVIIWGKIEIRQEFLYKIEKPFRITEEMQNEKYCNLLLL